MRSTLVFLCVATHLVALGVKANGEMLDTFKGMPNIEKNPDDLMTMINNKPEWMVVSNSKQRKLVANENKSERKISMGNNQQIGLGMMTNNTVRKEGREDETKQIDRQRRILTLDAQTTGLYWPTNGGGNNVSSTPA